MLESTACTISALYVGEAYVLVQKLPKIEFERK